jgi:D-glycero-D-manno-heptose 1,7-bisphosphate phosphatase
LAVPPYRHCLTPMKSLLTRNLRIKISSIEKLRSRTNDFGLLNQNLVDRIKPIKAVFLDKDGTLLEDVPYNVNVDRIRFCEGALEALKWLHAANYKLFIITNQSGVARGFFPESALTEVEDYLRQSLAAAGIPLAGFYYCPHHPEGIVPPYAASCTCRKPQPGMLYRAASEHVIDLNQSWFIGDILNDIEAGRKAGCRTILINNGNETKWQLNYRRIPHHIVNNLSEAARIISALDRPMPSLQGSPAHYPRLAEYS